MQSGGDNLQMHGDERIKVMIIAFFPSRLFAPGFFQGRSLLPFLTAKIQCGDVSAVS